MVAQTSHLWFVFTLEEGDILNCRICTMNKDIALDSIVSLAENDDKDSVWYKLVHFETDGMFDSGDTIYLVLKLEDDGKIEIICVKDQYETIDAQIRENEVDYWIDDLVIS